MPKDNTTCELSPIQLGMYFDCLIDDPVSYNLSASILLENIDEVHFENALKILVSEQAALRCSIEIINDLPAFRLHDEAGFILEKQTIMLDIERDKGAIAELVEREINTPFILSECPLFRAKLFKLTSSKYLLILCAHHLVADGLSFNVFIEKIVNYHNNLVNKKPISLKQDEGFLAFTRDEIIKLESGKYETQKAFWLKKLQQVKPLDFPVDFLVEQRKGIGKEKRFEISDALSKSIQSIAYDQEATVFMCFLAVFSVLMNRYLNRNDIMFTSPFSYRPDSELEESFGCFIRMLSLRFKIEEDMSFASVLQHVSKVLIEAYKNSDYPSNLVARDSLPSKQGTGTLFDVIFVYDTYEEIQEDNVCAKFLEQDVVTFPGTLMVVLNKLPDKNVLKIQYKSDLFKDETIELLGSRFLELLEMLAADPNLQISTFPSFHTKVDVSIDDSVIAKSKICDVSSRRISKDVDIFPNSQQSLVEAEVGVVITAIWKDVLKIEHVDLDDNFFDVGGNSLALINVNNKLKNANLKLSIREQFSLPTIRLLQKHFSKNENASINENASMPTMKKEAFKRIERAVLPYDIAIVGLSVNVPGAQSPSDFWHNLREGKESIRFYQDDELLAMGIPKEVFQSPNYVKAVGRVEGTEHFDPAFFDYTPADIQLMSPQYRLLYPGLWEAFEDAGYFPNSDGSTIGLFLSGSDDFEWYKNGIFNQSSYSLKYQAFTMGTNHFLATRLAYKLDIKGPVFTALSGCSSTLLTTHLACQSLILGECDIAVAGGITVELPNKGGYFYEEGMMFSPDGHCRPYDANAGGTFFANGMGLVVLKRLNDAIQDGDHIYAVIKGAGVNNDGAQKLGFTAPSVQGQSDAIQKAHRVAGLNPDTISYIEGHGTGTLLGDPIEIESLIQAFETDKKQFCTLGSVKGNIGHPDTAAGVVSLVKVALSFKNKFIPGTVNYQIPNPKIDFENSPFVVKSEGADWIVPEGQILRAGINSFGVGGTNVHMVLEEAPALKESSPQTQVNLFVFSARSESALVNNSKRVMQYLQDNPEINLSDAAWTLQVGRKAFDNRQVFVASGELNQGVENNYIYNVENLPTYKLYIENKKIFFMFSGQGSQYQGMIRDIYYSKEETGIASIVKRQVNSVIKNLSENSAHLLLDIMFGDNNPQKINETEFSQLALFTIEYALAQTLIEIGIKPNAMVGHSIGELAAATVAGVFSLKDAIEIVSMRGRIMQAQVTGTMLAVMADANEVSKILTPGVWLALDNTTNSCVVGGGTDQIIEFEKKCEQHDWVCIKVKTSHAFHTPMMENAAQEFHKKLAAYQLNEPTIPIVSNISGTWIKAGEITTRDYWAKHILSLVNFNQCLSEILKFKEAIFVEIGPGQILSTFVNQHVDKLEGQHVISLVRHPKEDVNDILYLVKKIGHLWCFGVDVDWRAFQGKAQRSKLSLPTYVFDKMSFPIDINMGVEDTLIEKRTTKTYEVVGSTLPIQNPEVHQNQIQAKAVEAYKKVLGFDSIQGNQDFFALGGDSLKAISLTTVIQQLLGLKIDVKDIFKYPTPAALAEYLKAKTVEICDHNETIKPLSGKAHYPLSSAQSRMYTLYLLDKESLAYNLPSATLIQGPLDYPRFESALKKLILRHELLRTKFIIIDNKPVQVINSDSELSIVYSDRASFGENEIDQLIEQFVKPFDLQSGPLFRVELIKLSSEQHLFLFDIHHILADGTSMEIITGDFNQMYSGELPPLGLHYKDFAVWERQFNSVPNIEKKQFWLSYLSGELPKTMFPTDFERPQIKKSDGSRIYFNLEPDLIIKLSKFSQDVNTTLFMTLLSAWTLLLARYSGQTDLIVGIPIANRNLQEVKDMIGMFVNILPIRQQLDNKNTFISYLGELKENVLNAFDHQDYPFDTLIQELNLKRDLSRNALFDICFDFQNMEFHDFSIDELKFTPYQVKTNTAAYDLLLTCQENKQEGTIQAFIDYSTSLFKEDTIKRLIENLKTLLLEVLDNKEILIENINVVSTKERQLINKCFNDTGLPIDEGLDVLAMFEHYVNQDPNKIAVIFADGHSLTYSELDSRAGALASGLLSENIQKEECVGILTHRNEKLFVAMFAILKAGVPFVLIDPALPKERISNIISQCKLNFLLCNSDASECISFNGKVINLDTFEYSMNTKKSSRSNLRSNLVYIMFTSGSTGAPKGVLVNQSALVNFIHEIKNKKIFQNSSDRVISVTTVSFDIFIFESLVPLCTGHSVYLADEAEQLDPVLTAKKILNYQVTHIISTISRVKSFFENQEFRKTLKQLQGILSGGENFPITLLNDLRQHTNAKIFNMYGPTETTIWSTSKELTQSESINIGRPIANTEVYIINSSGKIQPIGVFGELCISGRGVAQGYLNHPEETRNKFFEIEIENERRTLAYRTGDRARFLDNGELELQGRLDTQVKLRGYRVELSELENIVLQHPDVNLAAVVAFDDPHDIKQLALYYSLKIDHNSIVIDRNHLLQWLKERVPHYLLPTYFLHLGEMPRLFNGKINKAALPLPPNNEIVQSRTSNLANISDLEKIILTIWHDVLPVKHIGLNDNFFDLGGNSLGLIQVNNKLSDSIGFSVPLLQLFEFPTVSSLAKSFSSQEELSNKVTSRINQESIQQVTDIAVIGLAGKFPGADNIEQYWDNIVSGIESIAQFEKDELLSSGIDEALIDNPCYIRAKGHLKNVEYFDSDLFGYTKREATLMDPQSRVLHQCVWELLENAGYGDSNYSNSIGLFAGSSSNFLWLSSLVKEPQDLFSAFECMSLNEKDFLTTRISYKLNLKGPSFNIQTACSTSLVAIHQAIKSLQNGECEMAIAGGVSITYPRKEGYLFHEGLIFSRDGHCRPFSEDASGIVVGNGCGLVLLKPLDMAVNDNDHIYAVIKGSAINNDGIGKIGYTAPSIEGQSDVIKSALRKAKIEPEQLDYLEAHGTATKLGDPIEIAALKKAWGTQKKNYCAIGSVKANIGHLDAAAGVAGFIKTVMLLDKRTLPPLVNYNQANSKIDFENSPFYVCSQAKKINDINQILRAGVSSFGIGGTNAHVILEQAPLQEEQACTETIHTMIFSGNTQQSLDNTIRKVVTYLQSCPKDFLSNAAWTLQIGRKPLEYRKVLVINKQIEPQNLEDLLGKEVAPISNIKKPIRFLFSNDIVLNHKIGYLLYNAAESSGFTILLKNHMDLVFSFCSSVERSQFGQEETVHAPLFSFLISYALAKTWIDIGIVPESILGLGVGEIAALVVSEIVSIQNAIDLIREHGGNFASKEPGAVVGKITDSQTSTEENPDWIKPLSVNKLQDALIPILGPLSSPNTGAVLKENSVFIEMSPSKQVLSHIEKECKLNKQVVFYNSLIPKKDGIQQVLYVNKILGELWCQGFDINWKKFDAGHIKKRIPLPSYAFSPEVHKDDVIFATKPAEKQIENSIMDVSDKGEIRSRLNYIWQNLFGREISLDNDFFKLGGDSLKAAMLAANIHKEFGFEPSLADIFQYSTFKQLYGFLESKIGQSMPVRIPQVEKKDYYPTSSAQKRMYVVHQLIGQAVPYNLGAAYSIEGLIDKTQFKQIFDKLVQRHEAFRTRFDIYDGEVVQIIEDNISSLIEFEYYSGTQYQDKIKSYFKPFDLSKAPLFRAKLISLSDNKHILLIDMHHIIADQSAITILVREFTELYLGNTLLPLNIQYKDFSVWQNNLLEEKELNKQIAYWKNEFKDEIPVLDMPTDYPRPSIRTHKGERLSMEINQELANKINEYSKRNALTPFMIFMTALKLVLWKYTGQNDLVVGTASAGRRHADLFNVIGMFVNTLAIRTQISEDATVEMYLQHVKEKILKAYENQDCQFEHLVDLLDLDKDLSRNPLFDVVINYIDVGEHELNIDGLTIMPWPNLPVYSKFDITWTIENKNAGYSADIEFDSELYNSETIQALINRLLGIIRAIVEMPKQNLSELTLLTEKERQWLIQDVNQTATPYPQNKTVVQLFKEQVEQYGEKPALIMNNNEWTYYKLNYEANRVAALLSANGIVPGDRVAIVLDRSLIQNACVFGIFICGATYVPIDPKYPDTRIYQILLDSSPKVILTQKYIDSENIKSCQVIIDSELKVLNEFPGTELFYDQQDSCSPQDIAYVMYTSGSTGNPKGVEVTHQNIIRLVRNTNLVEITHLDKMLQLSNFAFDGAVFDIFGALLNGACLFLANDEFTLEMELLRNYINKNEITVFYIPTSLFNALVDWDISSLKTVRKILIGGESASPAHIRKAFEYLGPGKLVNAYGPTEGTVFSSCYEINCLESGNTVPIGYPLSNTKLFILDKQGQLVPPNITGELFIGGAGVAKGYLNQQELTNKKFIPNPYDAGDILYRTGDLVRRQITGKLIFMGRQDFQVKIRGFRVELGEVEESIKKLSGIRNAVVISQQDRQGHAYLTGYYTVDRALSNTIRPDEIKAFLKQRLPEYMIPVQMYFLESLPLNNNGKVDLKALNSIKENQNLDISYFHSKNPLEQTLLEQIRKILDNPHFGTRDNFFQFGGHSIKAISLAHELSKIGITLNVSEIFQYPTVEKLVPLLEEGITQRVENSAMKPLIKLTANQIDALVSCITLSWDVLTKIVLSGERLERFRGSPVQVLHSKQKNRFSGFITKIHDEISEEGLRKILAQMIGHHQLLHSTIHIDSGVQWQEYDLSKLTQFMEKSISYIDLRNYTSESKTLFLNELYCNVLLEPYYNDSLIWRCCCVRLDDYTHEIIWGFDHVAFDGMSAEILRSQIQRLIKGTGLENLHPEPYQNYVTLLDAGPSNITENQIIDAFLLDEWVETTQLIIKKLQSGRKRKDLVIEIPLDEHNIQDPGEFIFDLVEVLVKSYFEMDNIALGIVNYGRSYGNENYHHCIGEFLDILPWYGKKMDIQGIIAKSIEKCRIHSVNFLSLLFAPHLVEKFPAIAALMSPSFVTSDEKLQLILFNFQGFLPKEEDKLWNSLPSNNEDNQFAIFGITANYNETHLKILFPCLEEEAEDIQLMISKHLEKNTKGSQIEHA